MVDEQGFSLPGAQVSMSLLESNGRIVKQAQTDDLGRVTVSHDAGLGVSVSVAKDGYYRSGFRLGYGDQAVTVELRKIDAPIAMIAKKVKFLAQGTKEGIGYDLFVGDYVKPYGQGKVSDLTLRIEYSESSFWDYEYRLSVEFSEANDGLLPFYIKNTHSEFQSAYHAPLRGYGSEWTFWRISKRGRASESNMDKGRNYYFRIRSVVDQQGKVVSGYYGKIYGEFPEITYYLNPNENDTNIEYSGKSLVNIDDSEMVEKL
ncbi:hypothetical protein [Aurantivibrio plasticivorans]